MIRYSTTCVTALAAILAACLVFPQLLLAETEYIFRITVTNISDYEISPGGYVAHSRHFKLFEEGKLASPAIRSICETGHTPDFLYFTRREPLGVHTAFSFDGGAPAHKSAQAVFKTSLKAPLLSLAHKVSFTDDICVGTSDIELFDENDKPRKLEIEMRAFDAGTRENLKLSPPKNEVLAQLNWSYWRESEKETPEPIAPSSLVGSTPLARVVIEPFNP